MSEKPAVDVRTSPLYKVVKEKYDYHCRHDTEQRLEFAAGHKCALERAEYHRGWKDACDMVMNELLRPSGSLFDQ